MFYECYNKIGEKIGVAHTKKEAEDMIRYANWLLTRREEHQNTNSGLKEHKGLKKKNGVKEKRQ